MAEHRSIGEVLTLLQDDFPEITISKIRFLESQGLIDPERTPSGYRKFAAHDVDVLTWILRQQRDHFLPLRVIRERIERGDHLLELAGQAMQLPVGRPSDADLDDDTGTAEMGLGIAAGEADPGASPLAIELAALTMSAEELSTASGLSPLELAELETYGLLTSRSLGPTTYYDGEALLVARTAKEFADFGVEPRHLRMFRTAAEREASVFEQAILPVIQPRRPGGAAEARQALARLATLGERLRGAMMRAALSDHLE